MLKKCEMVELSGSNETSMREGLVLCAQLLAGHDCTSRQWISLSNVHLLCVSWLVSELAWWYLNLKKTWVPVDNANCLMVSKPTDLWILQAGWIESLQLWMSLRHFCLVNLNYVLRQPRKSDGWQSQLPSEMGELRCPGGTFQAWVKIHLCVAESQV